MDATASTRGEAHQVHAGDPNQTPALGNFGDRFAVDWLQQLEARQVGIRSHDVTFASMDEWAGKRVDIALQNMSDQDKEGLECGGDGWKQGLTLESQHIFLLKASQKNLLGHELRTLKEVAGIGGSRTPALALDMSHRLLAAPFHPLIMSAYPDLCRLTTISVTGTEGWPEGDTLGTWKQWQVGNISSTCRSREQGLAIVDLEKGGGRISTALPP